MLHAWADTYREGPGHSNTPEYLLGGYFNLLATLDDAPRMLALALDPGRQDRYASPPATTKLP